MNRKKIISLLMVLVLILGMSPLSSVSAKVNSGSFSFVAFPNRPSASFTVTCRAYLSGNKVSASFSYSYPSTPHYLQEVSPYIELYALDTNTGKHYEENFFEQSVTEWLKFNPNYAKYEYRFNGVWKGKLEL